MYNEIVNERGFPLKPDGHEDIFIAHGKVNQASLESKKKLFWGPGLVCIVFSEPTGERVLQMSGDNGDIVPEDGDIQ